MPLSNTFTVSTNLSPVVPRDTNAAPDLGYHYPPIDYLSSYCVVSNCTLLLTNGVVLAYFNSMGLALNNAATLISQGTPGQPNRVAYYRMVQEQATNLNTAYSGSSAIYQLLPFFSLDFYLTNASSVFMRFTSVIMPIGAQPLYSERGQKGVRSAYDYVIGHPGQSLTIDTFFARSICGPQPAHKYD